MRNSDVTLHRCESHGNYSCPSFFKPRTPRFNKGDMAVITSPNGVFGGPSYHGEIMWSTPKIWSSAYHVSEAMRGDIVLVLESCTCPNSSWPVATLIANGSGMQGWINEEALEVL